MDTVVEAGGEREEGEIVESLEYEDISSDEEFSLRLRIEELEARNYELEQIANISGLATNPYELGAGKERVGKENVKFRSRSAEERTPRKVRRAVKVMHSHPLPRRRHAEKAQRQKRRRKRPKSDSSSDEEFLNRDQLRMALNRSIESTEDDVIVVPVDVPVITIDDDDEEEDVLKLRLEALQSKQELKDELPTAVRPEEETEEQELRLIALKSAVVNKHEARKRRKIQQDCPYSPTDDLDTVEIASPAEAKADESNMDISPLDSPGVLAEECVAVDMEISSDAPTLEAPPEESEDEMTLRTLLLSKISVTKREEATPESPEVSLEEDCLRSLLLSSMKKPKVAQQEVIVPLERKSQILTEMPTVKVSPLIINLRESDSDLEDGQGSELENGLLNVDNKSPSSLAMESPCNSPASPHVAATEEPTPNAFQEKLDLFLKRARTNVEQQTVVPKIASLPKTPLALSHLPVSSQLEYRRLVARMNHLERQKKRQLEQKSLPTAKRLAMDSDKTVLKTCNTIKVVVQNDLEASAKAEVADLAVVVRKDETLRKKVLVKSATAAGVKSGAKNGVKLPVKQVKKAAAMPAKEEELLEKFLQRITKFPAEKQKKALEAYENHFANTSSTFLEGLDNLLVMVRRVQSEKIEQYRLQDELMRLRKQMSALEDALGKQRSVVQKLTPKMTLQHKVIQKQRNKCVSLNKMCLKLGELVVGKTYHLPSDTKRKLMEKFKVLTVETKRLKEIQVVDGAKKSAEEEQEESAEAVQGEWEACGATSTSGQASHNPYKSPLDHMNSQPNANPDAVVCPFDLMGKCEDSECHYSHLNESREAR
ncbi:uncharacterized protein LOC132256228 [Phlebotomus argentipes]|uniref:uncharacterized protein LOC132256228 n=1 Tax=Phlebotomus argentipes TaxID=94469 RepID=UPI0028937504|nr:uncharacterized protein LOC132256228 [Phlebotomus argentipes]XP_059608499.1 uncharacterized protein LOC132256228 [Phlebotomus argentipes]